MKDDGRTKERRKEEREEERKEERKRRSLSGRFTGNSKLGGMCHSRSDN
jgi:hypothetical protein